MLSKLQPDKYTACISLSTRILQPPSNVCCVKSNFVLPQHTLTMLDVLMDLSMTVVQPAREVVRPDNQLTLTEKQLDEELARTLTAGNPAAPSNIVRFRHAPLTQS